MEALLPLAVLACPIGMGLMMWFMMRGHRHEEKHAQPAAEPSLAQLQAEHERLGAEIEHLEERDGRPDRVAGVHS